MSFSTSARSSSPNWLRTLPMRPPLPTAFFTCVKPEATTSLPPTMPATELVTLPSTLYPVLTTFLPVVTAEAKLSTASRRGYTSGTETIQMQCCTLGGSVATLGKMPWYVGPAMTRLCVLSDRQSGPTTATAGPRNLTKCQPCPVMVNMSRSLLTLRKMSTVVWCWKSRYISTATLPIFLNICDCCMYSGYDP